MCKDIMVGLAGNNAFSNRRLGAALAQLDRDAFHAPRTGFFPSIAETANHILEVDLYYLDALEGGGRGLAVFDQFEPADIPAVLVPRQAAADARLLAFCEALTPERLAAEVITDRGEHGQVGERTSDLLLHLFQHQIHHRGQIHAMLSGTDVAPPQLDEFFLRFDEARREE